MAGEKQGPLDQFTIKPLVSIDIGGADLSFTNSSLAMLITVASVSLFLVVGMSRGRLVPGRWQSMAELSYEFVAGLLKETVGNEGRRYFPWIFTLFMFILFGNMLGMIPSAFTFTSHIIVTFAMALAVFTFVTLLAIVKHGFRFFSFFVPPGAPMAMWPLLIPIEVISYLSRPVSLSVRLFANMLAGHTLLKVFAGFVVALGFAGIVPLLFIVALTGLEILIAFLQAYVFTILTCLYINDALHLH
ncbi:MAG: F0F1 ATP synthase subunit A [Rhodospirillaceae bacterium]|nr:F0F1 ATP synthase subunit A [Rhodospirillaceae bacterium]MDE0616989.1 F0F1 ATP synthase subunit A [Rhodospirillaceae bacterium]MDE0716410.1 F0F1 ATP synthase subunit A [Rhodospirillaceae bacterium]MXY39304.1 F0F1 ATP synthase subunit A [Rhodospirillaceae bacterium]MYF06441.1 F0F1 ATP synthase subunit A [Rhodospirillaceae bacterium]